MVSAAPETVRRSLAEAANQALRYAMREDSRVVCWGEDIKGGRGTVTPATDDAWPKDMPTYAGLAAEFGTARVRDMPIAEAGFVGAAFGAAAVGLRPVVDVMFGDFIGVCLDQIVNQGAKNPFMNGGQTSASVVIRTAFGAGRQLAGQHSSVPYSVLAHFPGVKVVAPSTPEDGQGLMRSAIDDDGLVVFCDHRMLSNLKGRVPAEDFRTPLGTARLVTEGDDVVLIGVSRTVGVCSAAARQLAERGISATVLDLRSIAPLDEHMITTLASAVGRVVIVDDDTPRCGLAADVAALISQRCFSSLQAPVATVCPPNTPVPFSPSLERAYLPDADDVVAAAMATVGAR
jgi:pyruvate dehydrogenase E1 component beta subunit